MGYDREKIIDNVRALMQIENDVAKSYDDFPYESYALKETHPSHIYTIATLYGFKPTLIDRANVLELGCASGGNIIPMAFHLPNARFCGIDLSKKQIELGKRLIEDLQLKNISLIHQSILDFNPLEKFDYIICHGLYSWVDANIREKILEICKNQLTATGIAYISYNTFPGWEIAGTVRDMLLLYTAAEKNPLHKATTARSLLMHLFTQLKNMTTPYSALVIQEVEILLKHSDAQLIHEHLSNTNEPFYFHQFMQAANKYDLHFLAEAFLSNMKTENLPAEYTVAPKNEENRILAGQYMDFVKNRRFRATLLCHERLIIQEKNIQEAIWKCYLRLVVLPDNDNFQENDILTPKEILFTNSIMCLNVNDPFSKLVMWILFQAKEKSLHYSELCKSIMQNVPQSFSEIQVFLDKLLLKAILGGIIDVNVVSPHYVLEVTDKPLACPFARYQVYYQNIVTNRRHENIQLTHLAQALLPYLDGAHDIKALIQVINDFVEEGALLIVDENNQPVNDEQKKFLQIEMLCKKTLNQLANQAILIR